MAVYGVYLGVFVSTLAFALPYIGLYPSVPALGVLLLQEVFTQIPLTATKNRELFWLCVLTLNAGTWVGVMSIYSWTVRGRRTLL